MITREQLLQIYTSATKARIDAFLPFLNSTMSCFSIDTSLRMAAFLAQVGHESGQLRYVLELASGEAYEGREALGNIHAGDGVRYKGRGLIQLTGRANYEALEHEHGIPCVSRPEILETPENATFVAGWFWDKHGLNALADAEDFIKITKRVNGKLNGYALRLEIYERALKVLK